MGARVWCYGGHGDGLGASSVPSVITAARLLRSRLPLAADSRAYARARLCPWCVDALAAALDVAARGARV